ncbi:MAG: radical SAM protein [Armatimonadota bacterium]
MDKLTNEKLNKQETKEGKLVLESYPQELWLSVTNKCNLNCAHCKIGRPEKEPFKAAGRADMDRALFDKIKRQVFPFIGKVIFGGTELSEQLFCKDWDHIFEETSRFPLDIHIITNGTLLTEERIRKFVEREVVLSVSIESCKPQLYESVRGKFHGRIFELVKYGNELKKKLGKDKAVIKFGVTLFKDNIYELPELLTFAKELGVEEINTGHLCPQYEFQREQSLVYHKDTYNNIYDVAKDKASKLGIYLDLPPKFYIPRINEDTFHKRKTGSKCFWPWTAASIDQHGKVTPCCGSGSVMGNIAKDDFTKIWNSRKYKSLRKTVNTDTPPDYCRDCAVRTDGVISNTALMSAIGADKGFSAKRMLLLSLRDSLTGNKITKPVCGILEKIYKKIS